MSVGVFDVRPELQKKMKSYHTFSNLEYTIHMITLNTPRVKIGLFWKIHG